MTKFENDSLITLLRMKAKELKENPPKNGNQEAISRLADMADELYHGLIALNVLND